MGEPSPFLQFLSEEEAEAVIGFLNSAAVALENSERYLARRLLEKQLLRQTRMLDQLLTATRDAAGLMSTQDRQKFERMEFGRRRLIRQLMWAVDLLTQEGLSVTSPFNPLMHAYFRRQDMLRCQRSEEMQREFCNTSALCGSFEMPPVRLPPEHSGRASMALLRQFLAASSVYEHHPGDGDEDFVDPMNGSSASGSFRSVNGPDLDAVPGPSGESRRRLSISPMGPNAGDMKDQKPPTDAEGVSCVTPNMRADVNITAASRGCSTTSKAKPSQIAPEGGSEANIAQTPVMPHGAIHDNGGMADNLSDESGDSDILNELDPTLGP